MSATQIQVVTESQSLLDIAECPSGVPLHLDLAPRPVDWRRGMQKLGYFAKTLFLFTKSDFKTVIFPQTMFALAAMCSPVKLSAGDGQLGAMALASRVPAMLAWLWVHLLVEDIANQRLPESVVEDAANKPWRPLPSKRISPAQARRLLMGAIPLAMAIGGLTRSFAPSVCLMTLVWMYNDLEGSSSDIWLRNALNAGGLMCFSWGALSVLGAGQPTPLAYLWILVTGAIIMTTVHAQDFPDVEGDIARGRKTMPLLYGHGLARGSLAAMVMLWSVACPAFWAVGPWAWTAVVGVGAAMAVLTLADCGQRGDETVWRLWCLWVAVLYLLPAFAAS